MTIKNLVYKVNLAAYWMLMECFHSHHGIGHMSKGWAHKGPSLGLMHYTCCAGGLIAAVAEMKMKFSEKTLNRRENQTDNAESTL